MIDPMLELVGAWGGFALRWLWQATLISGLVLVLITIFHRAKPALRYGLLLIALLKLALPPIALLSSGPTLPTAFYGPTQSGLELWLQVPPTGEVLAPEANIQRLTWPALVLALYLLGVALASARLAAQARRLRRLRQRTRPFNGPLREATHGLAERLGLAKPPELLVSREATIPFLTGLRQPAVILPQDLLEDLDAQELERIVAHELAHLRHGDLWLNALLAVLGALWWFHPLFWMIATKTREVAEERSDARVIGGLKVPAALYARVLVRAATTCATSHSRAPVIAFFSGRRHPLERRLMRLARPRPGDGHRLPVTATVVAVLATAWLTFSATNATPSDDPLTLVFVHGENPSVSISQERHGDHRAKHSRRHFRHH